MEIALLLACLVFVILMRIDLNRMEYEMEQDAIRQDAIFKAIDDYMAQLERDQKEFVDKACNNDWEE